MDAAYAQRYRDLYSRHWWWRAREHLILQTLRSLAKPRGFPSILDVGCGDGLFFDRLEEFGDVEGLESDGDLVDPHGRWRDRIRIMPFDETFQPGRRYSLITMLDVLEHLPDAGRAMRLAANLLEPNGVLFLTVPAFQALWTSHDDINHHVRRFTRDTLLPLTDACRLERLTMRYFFFWTCPIKLLVRAKERLLNRPSPIVSVPAEPINRALYAVSRLEQDVLGRLSMPFGSSLMFVGRRRA